MSDQIPTPDDLLLNDPSLTDTPRGRAPRRGLLIVLIVATVVLIAVVAVALIRMQG